MKKPPLQHALLIGICTVSVLAGLFGYFFAPPQIPIWYSLPIPEHHLDTKLMLLLFPISIGSIAIAHAVLTRFVSEVDQALGKIFLFATGIPAIILLTAQLHILVITV